MKYINLNEVNIVGNLGQDPVVDLQKNKGRMSIANSDGYMDKNTNQWVDRTNWISVFFNGEYICKDVAKNLTKGCKVLAQGKLSTVTKDNKTEMYFVARSISIIEKKQGMSQSQQSVDPDLI